MSSKLSHLTGNVYCYTQHWCRILLSNYIKMLIAKQHITLLRAIQSQTGESQELPWNWSNIGVTDFFNVAIVHKDDLAVSGIQCNTQCPVPLAISWGSQTSS